MTNPRKIAVAGTHSTGKTSFLERLKTVLESTGLKVAYVHDSAEEARQNGFPILKDHTFESTSWLIGQAIRLEASAALKADVVLIDRPVPDALGYLLAALSVTNRTLERDKLKRLEAVSASWVGEYDLVFETELDPTIPLGPGRDGDQSFMIAAGTAITDMMNRIAPDRHRLRSDNVELSIEIAVRCATTA
jgi:hypothetical protein